MAVPGVVRSWSDDGWGVIDAEGTPGGCWTHWSSVLVPGFRELAPGQRVELEWERAAQDGYDFRTTRTWPQGQEPVVDVVGTSDPDGAYWTSLTLTLDGPDDAASP